MIGIALLDDVLVRVIKKCNNEAEVKNQLESVNIHINDENGSYKGLEQIINEMSSALHDGKLD